jgi:hypothetical protein
LAIILDTTLALDCIARGYCTLINLSSAGARSKPPHHTKQQLLSLINFSIHALSKLISIKTFTHSPVAAGDVMALEKFFGILIPRLARVGIIIIVVSFPGTHPIQCLSATTSHFGYLNITPHSAMALAV